MFPVNERIKDFKIKWIQHINRMKGSRIPKMAKDYNPRGRRKVGRPKKSQTVEQEQAAKV